VAPQLRGLELPVASGILNIDRNNQLE
jgi:hypothetical protein